ncbi:MAG: sulfatase-like hydrolase/transferase [Opitutales bacterium]|jgi:arylsulfatase A-like enzyme|nr:sulfatase-like hydrolase/transferase [Opitutales bacterium]MBT5170108.1 sulfatase-like hydrolase/transferase [Opitutales bacterium]MBT5814079.1 sulfatase-like hydrolase/transferase [Opitutales bacterium]MDG2254569.1 sulfatase-like hydrolase/transferase [Opitutaceae bacterium]
MKRIVLKLLSVLISAACLAAERPNVLIIFTDDQGYGDVGCYGNKLINTPRLNQLAEEGTRFTQFYAQPTCAPSRSALWTGRDPQRSMGNSMPAAEITIAEGLRSVGYETICIGKWNTSNRKEIFDRMPLAQGFDYYYGTLGANDGGVVRFHENNERAGETKDMSILTRLYTDKAIDYLRNHRNPAKPFFLHMAHTMMHTVIDASPAFEGTSAGGLYGDVVEEFDFETGRLLDSLDALGLRESTLVIFTSDNGPWNQPRYYLDKMGLLEGVAAKHVEGWYQEKDSIFWGSSGGLRGGKGSAYEGGSRVPCIIRWPGKAPAGQVSDALFASLDFFPTFAALTGYDLPSDRLIDGVDQTDLIAGRSTVGNRTSYIYSQASNGLPVGIRSGKWKLLLPGRKPEQPHRYLMDFGTNNYELYDLEADPAERWDLAYLYPETVSELKAEFDQFKATIKQR